MGDEDLTKCPIVAHCANLSLRRMPRGHFQCHDAGGDLRFTLSNEFPLEFAHTVLVIAVNARADGFMAGVDMGRLVMANAVRTILDSNTIPYNASDACKERLP